MKSTSSSQHHLEPSSYLYQSSLVPTPSFLGRIPLRGRRRDNLAVYFVPFFGKGATMRNLMLGILVVLLGVGVAGAEDWEDVTDPYKVFEAGYIQVVGKSELGQSNYAALRAAEVVAERGILEVLQGINIYGHTTVRDGMLASDEIQSVVKGYMHGAVKCGQEYYPGQRYAKVCMRLYLHGKGAMYDKVFPLFKDKGLKPETKQNFEPSASLVREATLTTTAEQYPKTPPADAKHHDGVIVDVQSYPFKPAVINRILTDKDEVVFEPSTVESQVLIQRGCGGFTKDVNKAKAMLKNWGSTSPMTVKSSGLDKSTDVKISSGDAAQIYLENKQGNMLAQGRVVFLLK
jgi:hypothetical protein